MVSVQSFGAGSQEALDFHLLIYHLAAQIPTRRVTTYGHLAYLAGRPENSRQVGYALKHLPHGEFHYNQDSVPWWRIIGSGGQISTISARQHQLSRLREELPVTDAGKVDIVEFGWFPEADDLDLEVIYPE